MFVWKMFAKYSHKFHLSVRDIRENPLVCARYSRFCEIFARSRKFVRYICENLRFCAIFSHEIFMIIHGFVCEFADLWDIFARIREFVQRYSRFCVRICDIFVSLCDICDIFAKICGKLVIIFSRNTCFNQIITHHTFDWYFAPVFFIFWSFKK